MNIFYKFLQKWTSHTLFWYLTLHMWNFSFSSFCLYPVPGVLKYKNIFMIFQLGSLKRSFWLKQKKMYLVCAVRGYKHNLSKKNLYGFTQPKVEKSQETSGMGCLKIFWIKGRKPQRGRLLFFNSKAVSLDNFDRQSVRE